MWRVKGDPQMQHSCGGIATILVFLSLTAILIFSLIGVFERSQAIVIENKTTTSGGKLINITTNQFDIINQPFMMAVDHQGGRYVA